MAKLQTPSRFLAIFAIALCLHACATSPTGRRQLMMVDDGNIAPAAAQSFEAMKETENVVTDQGINRYVQCVVDPLITEATARYKFLPARWEIVVFESEQVNAFAMPGGKVGVFTGLIQLTENPDQLAAVMGHEIAHVISRHSAERMSTAQMTVLGLTAAGIALANNENQAIIMAALGLGASYGIQLPFSRVHENEADQIGQEIMASAGFDPAQAARLWQVMGANNKDRQSELLSTHPDPDNRSKRLTETLETTHPMYNRARTSGKSPRCKLTSSAKK